MTVLLLLLLLLLLPAQLQGKAASTSRRRRSSSSSTPASGGVRLRVAMPHPVMRGGGRMTTRKMWRLSLTLFLRVT
jgi:hypothetical protein